MKIAILVFGAIVATAFADHKEEPVIPNMPDLNQLNNMMGGKMPEIPAGMKLDDLKDAFYNMPPSMKAKLNEMAESMGVKYDDLEDALNNPPQQLQDMFDRRNSEGNAPEGMFNIPQPEGEGEGPAPGPDMADMLKNIDLGSMGDMLKNVDIDSIMKNMDLGPMGDLVKNVDINGLMKNMDLGAMSGMLKNVDMNMVNGLMKNMDIGAMGDMMKNVDIGGLMKNMDLGPMGDIVKNVDIGGLMKNMDLGAMGDIMKNVDIDGLMKNMDLGAMGDMMKNVDINGLMKNMDLGPMGAILKNVDVGSMMKNMDMGMISGLMKDMDLGAIGNIAKNFDLKSIAGLMNGKMPSLGAMKSMIGLPEHAGMKDVKNLLRNKMDDMGIPTDSPIEALSVISEKMKKLPLPEGMDISPMLNQLHGQLEAMGMPDDPSKIREFVMEKLGLPADIKSIDELKEPGLMMNVMRKNVFNMLGIDDKEDPEVVMDRIVEQLREEAEKMGANLPKDATKDQMMAETDKILSKKLGQLTGLNTDSIMPSKLYSAAKSQLNKMGLPFGDIGSMKKSLMEMVKKQVMKKVVPMMMHMVMPKRRHQMPPQMPQQMPPQMMMPPHMMMPHGPMIPIDLNIEVNVEQPERQDMPPQIPSYLRGVEHAVHHEGLEDLDDEQLFHHIMAVREGLRSGEMAEEVLQEMIEDLMNARLKARVLSVRNMFLKDRLASMEKEMEMMQEQQQPAQPPMRSQPQNPLLKALLRPRVL